MREREGSTGCGRLLPALLIGAVLALAACSPETSAPARPGSADPGETNRADPRETSPPVVEIEIEPDPAIRAPAYDGVAYGAECPPPIRPGESCANLHVQNRGEIGGEGMCQVVHSGPGGEEVYVRSTPVPVDLPPGTAQVIHVRLPAPPSGAPPGPTRAECQPGVME